MTDQKTENIIRNIYKLSRKGTTLTAFKPDENAKFVLSEFQEKTKQFYPCPDMYLGLSDNFNDPYLELPILGLNNLFKGTGPGYMHDMQYIPERVSRCIIPSSDWCEYWYWSFHDEWVIVVKALIKYRYIYYNRLILSSTNWMDGDPIRPEEGHSEYNLDFDLVHSSMLTFGMESGFTQDMSESRGGVYNLASNTFKSSLNRYGLESFNKDLDKFIIDALEQAAVVEQAVRHHDERRSELAPTE